MITIKSRELSERQLAEIALAIQNRWNVPTFVKMHEIVLVDDDDEPSSDDFFDQGLGRKTVTLPLSPRDFERGFRVILENLEMTSAFTFERSGRNKFDLRLFDESKIPTWMREAEKPQRLPEGVYECPHCVPPDTIILGDDKSIAEYNVNDTTLGVTGLNKVTQKFVRPYEGEMVTIKANGLLPITTTPEHPILTATSQSYRRRYGQRWRYGIQSFSEERWVAAKDTVAKKSNKDGNYLIIPIVMGSFQSYEIDLLPFIKRHKPRHRGYRVSFPLNRDTAWLLGLYVAKGSVTKEIGFSLNKNEGEIEFEILRIARELGYSSYTLRSENEKAMLVSITSRVLARAFDNWCGHRAPNKKIPEFVLYHKDEKIVQCFIDGYEIGEGYVATNKLRGDKRYRVDTTTSRILAQQLQMAYVRLRRWAGICLKTRTTEGTILGRKCTLHPEYIIYYPLEPNDRFQKVRFFEDKVLCPVREVRTEKYSGPVHNIGTTDNTYLVSNAVVHNCGNWLNSEIELSLHTKLHYII